MDAMSEAKRCELRAAVGRHGEVCDGEACVYWRAVEHLGIDRADSVGCAIQYFELLGDDGAEVIEWLWSVKQRLEEGIDDE